MQWWSWTLIWIVLVLLLLGMLVLGGIHLWRKAKALLAEAGRAQERLTDAYAGGEALSAPEGAAGSVPVGWDAVFSDPAQVRSQSQGDKDERVARRRKRRIDSLYANARPRRWNDVMDPPEATAPPRAPSNARPEQ